MIADIRSEGIYTMSMLTLSIEIGICPTRCEVLVFLYYPPVQNKTATPSLMLETSSAKSGVPYDSKCMISTQYYPNILEIATAAIGRIAKL